MMDSLLSIIIPIYNTADYLDRCIESVISQSYKNIEILCVNDGSTDNSSVILGKWKRLDPRIKVYNKTNGGVASARNLGLDKATGEYIGWVDSDDWVENDYFENLMCAIESSKADMAIGSTREDITTSQIIENDNIIENFLLDRLTRALWKTVASSHLYKNERFADYAIGEDTLLLCKLFEKSKSICVIPSLSYHYEIRGESATHNISIRKYNDWMDVYLEIYEFLVSKNAELRTLCSKRIIKEMRVIYEMVKNAPLSIKKVLLKRMRRIFFQAIGGVGIKTFLSKDVKSIVYTGICLLIG